MGDDQRAIPRFTTAVSAALVAQGLFFAYLLFFRPGSMITGVDPADPTIHRLIFTLGTRSLSMAIALLLALILRNRVAVVVVLAMRVVTEALDLYSSLGSTGSSAGMTVVFVVILVLELAAIGLVVRAIRQRHRRGAIQTATAGSPDASVRPATTRPHSV